ncbi:winged helix-turn-helix transcriptional regulator [Streptomyces sp. ventii]|uniref:Winged helix-turn-helix transcriptional regulator n=2 Tax=Streptomyces spiramenti TaxID=2720606 RepID=A0ABX1AT13_9ACTN|nr:winged helix-turn-helix transcriptional regulator [Streptomyces spiramenti]NJP68876.1 winged helix-turn-helix transcriptional regulator [Streptomyces spiramenti]
MLAERLTALTERVAALEAVAVDASPPAPTGDLPDPDAFWALHRLRSELAELGEADGGVMIVGTVAAGPSGGRAEWQQAFGTAALLESDWTSLADTVAALGQPVRLRLIQGLLAGRSTVAELVELDGVGTTGQIYHHLRQLVAAGWLQAAGRGRYEVPPHRLVPLLVTLGAARG